MKVIKIGNVKIKNPIFLSPMVEVTDLAYREICRKAGAGMAYTEMIYLDAITHENERTKKLMITNKKDKPSGIQVTGNDVNELKNAIKLNAFDKFDIVDINCGCPSTRITGNQAGSFLLNTPEKIYDMIKTLKDNGHTATAKIRLGFKENNVMKVSKMIEKAGADALTIHARLATQGGSVKADWDQLKKVKNQIGIPLIGNGDVTDGKSAKDMLSICDGAMVARAAIGNPLIFKKINNYLKTGKEKEINQKDNIKLFKSYIELAEKYDIVEMGRIKYIGSNFIKSFEGAAKKREEFMRIKELSEMKSFIKKLI